MQAGERLSGVFIRFQGSPQGMSRLWSPVRQEICYAPHRAGILDCAPAGQPRGLCRSLDTVGGGRGSGGNLDRVVGTPKGRGGRRIHGHEPWTGRHLVRVTAAGRRGPAAASLPAARP